MKLGSALAALRRTHWHYCYICNKRFSGIKTARYCSNACRQKAKYRRAEVIRRSTPSSETTMPKRKRLTEKRKRTFYCEARMFRYYLECPKQCKECKLAVKSRAR